MLNFNKGIDLKSHLVDKENLVLSEMEYDENLTIGEELEEIILNTREQGQMIEALIESQIKKKDELIDKLHDELEHYKKDEAERYVEQVMKSIIKVRKDMKKNIESDTYKELSADDLRREYRYTFEDLTDLLEQQNIDEYSTPQGVRFDPAKHQAKIEVTDDISLDKLVKESIKEGYKRGDKILIPEQVIVYQYKKEK